MKITFGKAYYRKNIYMFNFYRDGKVLKPKNGLGRRRGWGGGVGWEEGGIRKGGKLIYPRAYNNNNLLDYYTRYSIKAYSLSRVV